MSYVGEKFGRIHSRARGTRELPFLLALLDHVHHPLRPSSASRVLPSLSLLLRLRRPFPSHLRDAPPRSRPLPRPLLAHPSMLLLALAAPLSLPPSRALSVRFHPRPSTFRVYRTIARAPITVTGRATSWLAVDVGGGRTADRRRRGRRRRRRRRRGRSQQITSETRRATERNNSPADEVISRSRNVPEEARALCCCLQRSQAPPRKSSIHTRVHSGRFYECSFKISFEAAAKRGIKIKKHTKQIGEVGVDEEGLSIVGGIDSQTSIVEVPNFKRNRYFR